jgi:hypothetical protein
MSVTEVLESAHGGNLVDNLSHAFGLSPEQIQSAIQALTPALSLGLQNAVKNPEVLSKVVSGLAHPTHLAAFDSAGGVQADLGREAISHLFGSDSAAGQVAQIAARDAGLRPDIMSKLLPILASIVLGGLGKSLNSQGLGTILNQIVQGGGLESILGQLGGATSAPPSQAGRPSGGGLGGLLGGLLGALLGGGRAPGGAAAPPQGSPLPGGLDPAALQAAIEMIKKSLAPGGPTAAPAGRHPELQDVLDRVFPK